VHSTDHLIEHGTIKKIRQAAKMQMSSLYERLKIHTNTAIQYLLGLLGQKSKPQPVNQLVDMQDIHDFVNRKTKTQTPQLRIGHMSARIHNHHRGKITTYQLPNQPQHTAEKQSYSSNNLNEWFQEPNPHGQKLFLCVGHAFDLLLCIINGAGDAV
jgi:hypothetical protein